MRRTLTLLLLCACSDPDPTGVTDAPVIEEARPAAGARAGAPVVLLGRNFGLAGPEDRVTLGGAPLPIEAWEDRVIEVRLPLETAPGHGALVVRSGARVSPPYPYEVLPEAPEAGASRDAGVEGP